MGGVADQQQAGAMPAREPARLDVEHRQLLPGLELVDTVGELGRDGRDSLAELRQASRPHLRVAALGDRAGDLPVREAIDTDQEQAVPHPRRQGLHRVVGAPREPEPEHVDWRGGGPWGQASQLAQAGEAPVGGHVQRGADLDLPVGSLVADTAHGAALLDQAVDAGRHDQLEARVAPGLLGNEAEELRLGHHGDVGELRRQRAKQVDGCHSGARRQVQPAHLGVAQLEQALGEPQLIQELQHRGVQGVAAKVALEVGVALQQNDRNALAGEQEREHRAARATPDDAAGRLPHACGPRAVIFSSLRHRTSPRRIALVAGFTTGLKSVAARPASARAGVARARVASS